jgi:hypothetical protein
VRGTLGLPPLLGRMTTPTPSPAGSQQQAGILSGHRCHHPHHAEMRGLAAPSPPNEAPCRPRGHNGRHGRQRRPGPPPRHPSPPHAPCSLGLPICNSRRSCHLGMKGELPLATRGDEGSSRPSAAQALSFLRWRWGMKVEGAGPWLGSGKAVYHVYNHKLIFL